MNERYNGWTNYETWNVNLWMDNDQGLQEYWNEKAQAALDSFSGDKEEAAYYLADEIENEHNENMPELPGAFGDLLSTALGAVDWQEIAESWINDNYEEWKLENEEETEAV